MSSPYSIRRERLLTRLRSEGQGASALLITSVTNVHYLTGFTGDSSALLLSAHRALVISDGRYAEQIARECPDVEVHIRPIGQPLPIGVAEVVAKLGHSAVAIEGAHLSLADAETLRATAPTTEWRSTRGWTEHLRMVKDEDEIRQIRDAVALAEQAMRSLGDPAESADLSEKSFADRLEFALRDAGALGSAFPPIVARGANASLPHYRPSATALLRDSTLLLVDWGATGPTGYRSDLTRTFATGTFADRFEEIHRAVLHAQTRAIEAIRPGRKAREIDSEAREALKADGLAEFFTHGLGHGIGLDIHEMPFLGREPDITLAPGMVLTIEPGVYIPGWGGVRIEDDILVTPDGAEILSSFPRSPHDDRR